MLTGTRAASRSSRTTWPGSARRSWRPAATSGPPPRRTRPRGLVGASREDPRRVRRHEESYGWVTTLPHSAGHSHSKTMADFLHGSVGCFRRLGGVPDAMVVDNDSSIVADGVGRNARLHPEVAALCGHLGLRIMCSSRDAPSPRARSSGPTGTWRPRSCRCGCSPTSRTCRSSPTGGPMRWRSGVTTAGWAVGSARPWLRNGGTCTPCPTLSPTSTCAPRSGSSETGS